MKTKVTRQERYVQNYGNTTHLGHLCLANNKKIDKMRTQKHQKHQYVKNATPKVWNTNKLNHNKRWTPKLTS